uniref:C-type lectin domain-containing protein n=1 Tax=Panagrellus redivivus TaxID=6233 RepID=A0A7E4UN62_PANRE
MSSFKVVLALACLIAMGSVVTADYSLLITAIMRNAPGSAICGLMCLFARAGVWQTANSNQLANVPSEFQQCAVVNGALSSITQCIQGSCPSNAMSSDIVLAINDFNTDCTTNNRQNFTTLFNCYSSAIPLQTLLNGGNVNTGASGTCPLGPTNKTATYTSTKPYLLVDFHTGSSDYHGTGFVASFTSLSSHTIKPPTTASTGDCRYNWQKDEDFPYCYKYHPNAMTWDQAQATCKRDDADLVAITRTLQQFWIYQYINGSQAGEKSYPVYIGFHRDNYNDWAWVDGTYKQEELWLPGEPSHVGDCAAIRMSTATTRAGWYAVNCAETLPFVCYYEIRKQLPPK